MKYRKTLNENSKELNNAKLKNYKLLMEKINKQIDENSLIVSGKDFTFILGDKITCMSLVAKMLNTMINDKIITKEDIKTILSVLD